MSEPNRDRWGRYLITPLSGGEPVAHTRCTDVAKVLDDTFNLELWKQRHLAKGLASRPDLVALAQAVPLSEKKQFNRLCKDAINASAASSRANIGTALHAFTEQVDRGESPVIPDNWMADVRAYREACVEHGIQIYPDLIEVIAVCDALEEPVAGTFDRVVGWGNGDYVADIKTGDDLYWQWRAIVAQLAIYSRSASMYDPEAETHSPMPPVNQDAGIVFHLPAGQGVCTPYLVDLNAGWEAAQMSVATRLWRKRNDLAEALAA